MRKLLIIVYFIFMYILSLAHPHVYFENTFTLNILPNEVTVNLNLILDEMNTLLIKENNNSDELYKSVFRDFKFTYNGKLLNNNIINKNIDFNDENLILNIVFKFQFNVKKDDKLIITIYDKEYFYDYDYNNSSFNIKNSTNLKFTTNFKENKKKAYYYDMIYPKEFEVTINEK